MIIELPYIESNEEIIEGVEHDDLMIQFYNFRYLEALRPKLKILNLLDFYYFGIDYLTPGETNNVFYSQKHGKDVFRIDVGIDNFRLN
jgi:hypothetical protein